MKTRYERLRDQSSHIWKKRRKYEKERRKHGNIICRNTIKIKGGPDRDTSLKQVPMLDRVMQFMHNAFAAKKEEHQQHQQR